MLRYREALGLLPAAPTGGRPHRGPDRPNRRSPGAHRQYDEVDLSAVRRCLELEQRYDITPAALAFGLRVLAEPAVALQMRALAQQLRRLVPPAARALDFEQQRAQRWLRPAGDPRPE